MDNASLPPLPPQHSITFQKPSHKGSKQKVKRKAANSYGQFLRQRRKELTDEDPNAKMKLSEFVQEWRCMGPAEKQIFKERHRKEKEKMGIVNGKGRKSTSKDKEKKVKKLKDSHELEENPTVKFLETLEDIDQKIKEVKVNSEVVREELSHLREVFAVNKFKLKSVTDELEALKVKHQLLIKQHDFCV